MPYDEVCFQRLEQDNPEDYEKLTYQKRSISLKSEGLKLTKNA